MVHNEREVYKGRHVITNARGLASGHYFADKSQSLIDESRIAIRICDLVFSLSSSFGATTTLSPAESDSDSDSSGATKCRAPDTVKRCGSSERNFTVETASGMYITISSRKVSDAYDLPLCSLNLEIGSACESV